MDYVVTRIPDEALRDEWHRAVPHLRRALAYCGGRYDMRTLYQAVRKGQSQLWMVFDAARHPVAAFTTHIARYPLKAILTVDFIGGRGVSDWLQPLLETLDRYVIAHQLSGLETCARFGWQPLLARHGWKQTMAFYEKSGAAGAHDNG